MTSPSASIPKEPGSPTTESLPPHTSEIGTLKKLPDHGTDWLGSSSGVFFVNTVRRAFSAAFSASSSDIESLPAAEDILAGGEIETPTAITEGGGVNGLLREGPSTSKEIEETLAAALGKPPDRSVATDLVMGFFKAWHPLFPFLHGPTFLKDMEALYPVPSSDGVPVDIRKAVTFQLVISVASLDRPDISLPIESRIKSNADIMRIAGVLSSRHDIATIQALLAAEIYLIATISLREASTIGGMLLRSMFHAGLHRCPLRYAQLSAEDCEIRRRIFWSAYALDRHLSQSLGYPLTLQDSDIDVCLSGARELHIAVSRELLVKPAQEIYLHMPTKLASSPNSEDSRDRRDAERETKAESPSTLERQRREAPLTFYVQYSRLTGRVIETFHKSIHARFPKREAILYLTSDIEAWWNDLPGHLSGEDPSDVPPYQQLLGPFFTILYQQLLLLMNRPSLSLEPSSPSFQHGLQVCIKASRTILSALRIHHSRGQTMFWPGLLSANWMAGLIIAFACQLGKYPVGRACTDIQNCLDLLQAMDSRWHTARQCYLVLSSLLADIQKRNTTVSGYVSDHRTNKSTRDASKARIDSDEPSLKRQRTSPSESSTGDPLDRNRKFSENGEASTSQGLHAKRASKSHLQDQAGMNQSNDLFTPELSPVSTTSRLTVQPSQPTPSQALNMAPAYQDPLAYGYQPTDIPISNYPTDGTDPSRWNNFDFNVADVFGSATWENLTGATTSLAPSWEF